MDGGHSVSSKQTRNRFICICTNLDSLCPEENICESCHAAILPSGGFGSVYVFVLVLTDAPVFQTWGSLLGWSCFTADTCFTRNVCRLQEDRYVTSS